MSSELESREAQSPEKRKPGRPKEDGRMDEILESKQAPAVISGLSKSDPPKPEESDDVQIMSWQERIVGKRINTLDVIVMPDHDANPETHPGPWIDYCAGVVPETRKKIVHRLPGKEVKVKPEWVMKFHGNVVKDHLSTHTAVVRHNKIGHGYCFDKFFVHNGKEYDRCCLIMDRIHQAGLIYEKFVPKGKTVRLIRMKPMKDTPNKPIYTLIKADEGTYRDLKRLYERHFLRKNDGVMDEDPALRGALEQMLPEISTE